MRPARVARRSEIRSQKAVQNRRYPRHQTKPADQRNGEQAVLRPESGFLKASVAGRRIGVVKSVVPCVSASFPLSALWHACSILNAACDSTDTLMSHRRTARDIGHILAKAWVRSGD